MRYCNQPRSAVANQRSERLATADLFHWSMRRVEAMCQQEARERVLVQRLGDMGGMIQFTQVESEKHFVRGEVGEVRS